MRSRGLVAVILTAVAVAGCGESDGVPREPVSGTVTLDGQPLASGFISFQPDSAGVSTQGGGMINAGAFSIPKADGLSPGKYKVMITSGGSDETKEDKNDAPGMPPAPAKEAIPAAYNTATTLTADVTAGGENAFTFALEKSAKK